MGGKFAFLRAFIPLLRYMIPNPEPLFLKNVIKGKLFRRGGWFTALVVGIRPE